MRFDTEVFLKRLLFTLPICLAGVLIPFTLIHSLPIQSILAPVPKFSISQIGASLPEYAKLFFMGIGLIGIGRIGRKIFLRKRIQS